MRRVQTILVGAALVLAQSLSTQSPCQLVKDINTEGIVQSSFPGGLVTCGAAWYFAAYTVQHGRELWKTDGTPAGTAMVKDIWPGDSGSLPFVDFPVASVGNLFFFVADDGSRGTELWRSDGSSAGTVLVKDIFLDASSFPKHLQVNSTGKEIYFQADDGVNGIELWKTGGTAATTTMVKDIIPGAGHSVPSDFQNHNGVTLFMAKGGLWNEGPGPQQPDPQGCPGLDAGLVGQQLQAPDIRAYQRSAADGWQLSSGRPRTART